jgi:hypothetical protein
MPDLDEDNQEKQENEIYAAFFWGLIEGYVKLYEENARKVYRLEVDTLKMDDARLIVSNGTECDKFYEVLDAISIYPELVEKINSRVEMLIENEVNESVPVDEGILFSGINRLVIKEPGLGSKKEPVPASSIFSIPLLMKKSTTQDEYYEEDMIQIIKVEISEIRKYLEAFYSEKEIPEQMGSLLKEQFVKYIKDVEIESKVDKTIFRESLFDRTCSIIAAAFEELDLFSEAKAVRGVRDDHRK